MIVDSHTHAWARWPYEPEVPDEATKGSVEHLIHEMDQNGVAEAVIVSARIEKNPDNNAYGAAAVRRYPKRLHQFADVDCAWSPEYHTPGAVERLRMAAGRCGSQALPTLSAPMTDGSAPARPG
ncbi:hypothetical protein, partial [Devosia insulae]|uniref:hypothetical protein n=1 Tax=Devosia insulae TaxID=408174 RepID=UPI00191BE092